MPAITEVLRRALRPASLLSLGATIAFLSFIMLRWKDLSDYDSPHSRPWNVSTDYRYEYPRFASHSVLGRHIALIVFLGAVAAVLLAIAAMRAPRFRLWLRLGAVALALASPVAWLGIDAWASRRHPTAAARDPFHDLAAGFWGFAAGCLIMAVAAVAIPSKNPAS